jgi:hypothetical protein
MQHIENDYKNISHYIHGCGYNIGYVYGGGDGDGYICGFAEDPYINPYEGYGFAYNYNYITSDTHLHPEILCS